MISKNKIKNSMKIHENRKYLELQTSFFMYF